jgi:transglutaminase-like putative cysteine protease
LESRTSDIVFCIHPVINAQNDVALQYDYSRNQLSRPEDSNVNRVTLLTTGLRGERQLSVTPSTTRMRFGTPMLEIWQDRLRDRLKEISDRVVADVPEEDRYQRIRALESYLRDSQQFLYSLNSQPQDTSIDPIEDFLLNTKRGHCEYFATALALLLRSQNIPARMVVGFKGGEWNSLGEYYRFQQLHAHAWVEAYLRPEQIPAAERRYFDDWDNGAWVRIDPTPASTAEEVAVAVTVSGVRWSEVVDYVHYLWTSYVLRLDAKSQYDMIYLPLARLARGLFQPQSWMEFFQRARGWLGGPNLRDWFNWRAGLAAMVLCLLAVGLFRMAHYLLYRWLSGRRGELAATVRGGAVQVEFYRRFEELLARYDFVRLAGQTPRELAALVAQRIGVYAPAFALSGLQRVVEAFYRVRFGRRPLDNTEEQAIEQALFELEAALQKSRLGSSTT